MTLPPIVARELRLAARQSATYWSRLGFALMVCAITVLLLFSDSAFQFSAQRLGQQLFIMLAGISFFYSLVGSVFLTADSVSSEKREGTLGFLFLTDLKGRDVVFGKMAATSIKAFYGLLAVVPMISVVFLFGGITNGEVLRMALLLPNTMFFSLAAGMLVSTLVVQQRKAFSSSFLLVAFLTVGLPFCGGMIAVYYEEHGVRVPPDFFVPWIVSSPGYCWQLALQSEFSRHPHLFYISFAIIHLSGWLFLFLASQLITRTWQDRPDSRRRMSLKERVRSWAHGNAAERAVYRRQLLNINGYFWLASRNRQNAAYVWLFLGSMALIWIWSYFRISHEIFEAGMAVVCIIFLHSILKLWIAIEAGRKICEDYWGGALELILSTRITVAEILEGQWLALRRQFFKPMICVLMVDLLLWYCSSRFVAATANEKTSFTFAVFGAMAVFIVDFAALGWTGMWRGLAGNVQRNVVGETILRILVLPWICVLLFDGIFALLKWKFDLSFEPEFYTHYWIWLIASLLNSAHWWMDSREKLLTRFRLMALRRFDPELQPRTFWYYLGRGYAVARRKLASA